MGAFPGGILLIGAFPGTLPTGVWLGAVLLIGALPGTLQIGAFPDLLTGAAPRSGISEGDAVADILIATALPGDFTAVGLSGAALPPFNNAIFSLIDATALEVAPGRGEALESAPKDRDEDFDVEDLPSAPASSCDAFANAFSLSRTRGCVSSPCAKPFEKLSGGGLGTMAFSLDLGGRKPTGRPGIFRFSGLAGGEDGVGGGKPMGRGIPVLKRGCPGLVAGSRLKSRCCTA
jgi:hypothetical protein